MKRRFRLKNSNDIKIIRQAGKSFSTPLVVLITLPNQSSRTCVGILASKRVGDAVRRNRCKRLMRAAVLPFIDQIESGNDFLLIARRPLLDAKHEEIRNAIKTILSRALLLKDRVDD